jgi:predicted aspartyl protease
LNIRPTPALLLAAMLTGCVGSQTCQLPPSISLTLYDGPQNLRAVMAGLGGTPAALLVDTGSSTSIVSPSVAQQAGLAIQPIQGDLTLNGMTGNVPAGLITVPQFTLGTATAANAQFVVATMFHRDSPLDGILGDDFLRNYDIDLNIPEHEATLYPSTTCATAALPWQSGAAAVPVHEDKNGRMYLTVVIAGHSVEGLLDSGAEISSMPLSLFESSGLAASGEKLAKGSISGISGTEVEAGLYQFSDMLVGNVRLQVPKLAVYSPLDYADAQQRERAHALAKLGLHPDTQTDDNGTPFFVLGLDFISHHRLFISHSTDMLYIQASQPGG